MIKLVRVDHRLLHGQVAFSWTKVLGTDCILIANDAVATDQLRMSALRMAKPDGVKLVIKNIADSIKALNSGVTDKYKLMIIVETIDDIYRLTNEVKSISTVNLGGAKSYDDTKQISKAFFVSKKDIEQIYAMKSHGIELTVQMVPDEAAKEVSTLLPKGE